MDKRSFLLRLFFNSSGINEDNFLSLLERNSSASLIDLGCGEGDFTMKCVKQIGTNDVWGVEIDEELAKEARRKGIKTVSADLNEKLPLESNSFDVILSNQVLEHLINSDLFVKEIYRLLRPYGYAVVSTENLSSWHNIFALALGYRPFSLDYSYKIKIGNPLSPHSGEAVAGKSLAHLKIFPYQALKELFEIYGFRVEKLVGGGYYLMPISLFSKVFSKIDTRHAHFLTLKLRKSNIESR
jgi:SAM-dependent methyltransferase